MRKINWVIPGVRSKRMFLMLGCVSWILMLLCSCGRNLPDSEQVIKRYLKEKYNQEFQIVHTERKNIGQNFGEFINTGEAVSLNESDDAFSFTIYEDGRITDSQGRTVDFKNTIIIMTSNLGSQYLLDGIDADGNISPEAEKEVMEDLQGHFRPEFLNRLDEIIMFKPLSKENIGGIIRLLMDDLNKRLSDREIKVALSPEAEHFVVEHGYDPVYGARPLKRFLQKHVETLSAKLILEDQVRQGDTILIDVKDGALTASVQK